jgi:hypothetical protein
MEFYLVLHKTVLDYITIDFPLNPPSHVQRKIIPARDTLDYPIGIHFD